MEEYFTKVKTVPPTETPLNALGDSLTKAESFLPAETPLKTVGDSLNKANTFLPAETQLKTFDDSLNKAKTVPPAKIPLTTLGDSLNKTKTAPTAETLQRDRTPPVKDKIASRDRAEKEAIPQGNGAPHKLIGNKAASVPPGYEHVIEKLYRKVTPSTERQTITEDVKMLNSRRHNGNGTTALPTVARKQTPPTTWRLTMTKGEKKLILQKYIEQDFMSWDTLTKTIEAQKMYLSLKAAQQLSFLV